MDKKENTKLFIELLQYIDCPEIDKLVKNVSVYQEYYFQNKHENSIPDYDEEYDIQKSKEHAQDLIIEDLESVFPGLNNLIDFTMLAHFIVFDC